MAWVAKLRNELHKFQDFSLHDFPFRYPSHLWVWESSLSWLLQPTPNVIFDGRYSDGRDVDPAETWMLLVMLKNPAYVFLQGCFPDLYTALSCGVATEFKKNEKNIENYLWVWVHDSCLRGVSMKCMNHLRYCEIDSIMGTESTPSHLKENTSPSNHR